MYFNLSLQISIFFLFLLSGGGSFGLTDPKVSINQMLSHGTYMLHNGSIIPMDNENKVVVIRNSLYYVTSQDRVLDVTTSIPTVPLTLPALAGGSNDFNFTEVLNRLYSE